MARPRSHSHVRDLEISIEFASAMPFGAPERIFFNGSKLNGFKIQDSVQDSSIVVSSII